MWCCSCAERTRGLKAHFYFLVFILALSSVAGWQGPAPTFVVTGGPCSGKTTAIDKLPAELSGWDLLKVPEAATLYFERGGRFPFATPPDVSEFFGAGDRNLLWESWLVELKLSLENHAQSAAARSGGRKTALLCDRGIFDSRAYLASDDEWRRHE